MKYVLILTTFALLLSCSEHHGHHITLHKGDFRFDGSIGEFFDCERRKKYFISKSGIHDELKEKYDSLGLNAKDDAYVHIEGYIKSEALMEGLDPENVFVAAKLIKVDTSRGCHLRQE